MIDKIKMGLVGCIALTIMAGTAYAFTNNTISEIKDINRELTKIEIDVYGATQKKALREAEINRLTSELALINNHINERQKESESLVVVKKELMTGEVFMKPLNQ